MAKRDLPILGFPARGSEDDFLTLGDIVKGVMVLGGVGSGKSSGSGQFLAHSFLAQGFGGLVLTAKQEEVGLWREYAAKEGRSQDLIVVNEQNPAYFNFLDYERQRSQGSSGTTQNIYAIFADIAEQLKEDSKANENAFFKQAAKELFENAIDILAAVRKTLKIEEIIDFIRFSPNDPTEAAEYRQGTNFFCLCMQHLDRELQAKPQLVSDPRFADLISAQKYFLLESPRINSELRSNILSSLTVTTSVFRKGLPRLLMTGKTTLTPDVTFNGKIIILDFPVNKKGRAGLAIQLIWKYMWQQAALARTISNPDTVQPTFLWADEAQFFMTPRDIDFVSQARSYQAPMIYLSQNIGNIIRRIGRDNGNALLSMFQIYIFHYNADMETNKWAAEKLAKDYTVVGQGSTSTDQQGNVRHSTNLSEQYRYLLEPNQLRNLRNGDQDNNYLVEAIIQRGPNRWKDTDELFRLVEFNQKVFT